MLIRNKILICLIIMAVMLAGCATKAVKGNNEQARPAEKLSSIFSKEPSDRELFDEALSYLTNNPKEPNYHEAKVRLERLVAQFPESKWVAGAQALISTLDRISVLQDALTSEKVKAHGTQVRLAKEIESLRSGDRQIEGKYSAEINRLQQENEQLKNDIRQLKDLEIRLEKREKMLR